MATKTHTYGTILSYSSNGSTYTDLADMKDVDAGEAEASNVETTHLSSPNAVREFIAGLINSGELNANFYFTKAQWNSVNTIFVGRSTYYWRLKFPLISGETANSKWEFQGHIQKIGRGKADEDGTIMAALVVKITGPTTFTAGS
jgi:hypothetical protein